MTLTPSLTSTLLHQLARHRAATTAQLMALLDLDTADDVQERLTVLQEQGLIGRSNGVWFLTEDGSATAAAGLDLCEPVVRPPITTCGVLQAQLQHAVQVLDLGLAHRALHRAAGSSHPFVWDPQVLHRVRGPQGRVDILAPDARLRAYGHDTLLRLWTSVPRPRDVQQLLAAYRAFSTSTESSLGPWTRWYPRTPQLQLLAVRPDWVEQLYRTVTAHGAGLEELVHVAPAADTAEHNLDELSPAGVIPVPTGNGSAGTMALTRHVTTRHRAVANDKGLTQMPPNRLRSGQDRSTRSKGGDER